MSPRPAPPGPRRREVVSYDPRAGRLTPGQRRAWGKWWSTYGREFDALTSRTFDEPGVVGAPLGPPDLGAWFDRDAPVVVEIGSGMGESTVAMAAAEPDVSHLAIEVYQPGLAQLLMRINDTGVTNLRLLRGDAVAVLREMIRLDTLAGIRIYFPDPWPKQRHHKRRLVQPGFVSLAASRLVTGGTLHLATDWADYAEQMRAVCTAEPLLGSAGTAVDGSTARPPWRPVTKFEQRAQIEGRPVWDLLYERLPPVR